MPLNPRCCKQPSEAITSSAVYINHEQAANHSDVFHEMKRYTAPCFVVSQWDFPKFIEYKRQWNPIEKNQKRAKTRAITQ